MLKHSYNIMTGTYYWFEPLPETRKVKRKKALNNKPTKN